MQIWTKAEMDDTEILSQIFIEEYAQELSVKGPLSRNQGARMKPVETDSDRGLVLRGDS